MKATLVRVIVIQALALITLGIGVWILWGQWQLLTGIFFLTFSNNLAQSDLKK